MLGSTITGITAALANRYGNQCGIYMGNEEVDTEAAYFRIIPLKQSRVPGAGNRYRQYQAFEVAYHPLDNVLAPECMDVLSQLFDTLEYIQVEGRKTRGDKMEGEIREGVLHFYIHYDLFVVKEQEDERMEEADICVMERT